MTPYTVQSLTGGQDTTGGLRIVLPVHPSPLQLWYEMVYNVFKCPGSNHVAQIWLSVNADRRLTETINVCIVYPRLQLVRNLLRPANNYRTHATQLEMIRQSVGVPHLNLWV